MKSTALLAALALMVGVGCSPLQINDDASADRAQGYRINGYDHGMQPVSHTSGASQRSYGWRYFSDPATDRAVVISPQGDYYFSGGRGLHWVAGTPSGL